MPTTEQHEVHNVTREGHTQACDQSHAVAALKWDRNPPLEIPRKEPATQPEQRDEEKGPKNRTEVGLNGNNEEEKEPQYKGPPRMAGTPSNLAGQSMSPAPPTRIHGKHCRETHPFKVVQEDKGGDIVTSQFPPPTPDREWVGAGSLPDQCTAKIQSGRTP